MLPENNLGIHKALERLAAQRGDKIALTMAGWNLSYKELDSRANFLARHLQLCGVQRGEIVAIRMTRSAEMVLAMVAILKCGAAYFPMDDSNPVPRNRDCLEIADVNVILSNLDANEVFAQGRGVISTEEGTLFQSALDEFESVDVGPDERAYVMFTSGSTGTPKGVVVPHRAVLRLVIDTNYIDIRKDDNILQFAPASFDASTFEIWGALLNGAGLVLYSGPVLDPNLLKREISDNKVTVLWLTAALFHLVTEKFIEALSPLRVLLAGGDVLNARSVKKTLDNVPGVTVINGYGPTENTTFTCCHVMTTENPPVDNVLIGKAISGTEIHVLDEYFDPVQRGQEGELFTSGRGVALGYLNDPDSRNAFFYDEKIAPGLIYRTGDLVRKNDRDELEFIGRKDNQIKLRGYRVSLEEIKANIVRMEYISDALVLRESFESGDQILIAYIQVQEDKELSSRQVEDYLASVLPKYMIPDQFVFDTELPITNNGKLDRKSIQKSMKEQCEVA